MLHAVLPMSTHASWCGQPLVLRRCLARAVVALWLGLLGCLMAPSSALAQPKPQPRPPTIYSCVDAEGRRLSSDRPIPECLSQVQRLHNRDGSVRGEAPPFRSPDEQARLDRLRQQAEREQAAREEAARRDRSLLARFPNEMAHAEARALLLAPVLRQIEEAEARLDSLKAEAQAVAPSPARPASAAALSALQRERLAANAGAREAQRLVLADRLAERDRLNLRQDEELARLRRLWAGAPPGSLDAASKAPAAPAARPEALLPASR